MKTKKLIIVIMLSFLFCFSFLFSSNNKVIYAEVPEGEQVAVGGDTVTMYYLKVPVKGITMRTKNHQLAAIIVPWTTFIWNVFEDMAILTNDRTHTFILTYNKIKVNGKPLLTTWNIECSSFGSGNFFGGFHDFYPKNDININIRSEYYSLFQTGDFTEVTITYMYGGNGYLLGQPIAGGALNYIYDLSGATLYTREVPIDYDPIISEGQAPDNGGIALSPYQAPPPNWIESTKNWLKEFPNSLKNFFGSFVLYVLVIVVAVLIFRYAKPKK